VKAIVNPEWESAPFELQYMWSHPTEAWRPDPYPKRFNIAPPETISTHDDLMKWALENEVPQFIQVPD
jgi:hypothetical protein